METFDYIVVGAGTAGCVLADRLSADGRASVLALEAGGSDRRPSVKLPIGYGIAYYAPRMNWRYLAEPEESVGGRALYVPRGKGLGGSSSINAMVYCRGLPADYDDWRAAGNPGWGWSDVEPIFRRFERHVAADGSVSGGGPLWVSDRSREYHPITRHFLAAAETIGLKRADLNGAEPEGVGPYALNTRRGLRWSAADAFLRPAMRRPNVSVRTGAFVERIRFEGRRAVGVEARLGRAKAYFACRGEVILAAGAIDSPRLLQRSGVGPGPLLAGFGLPLVHANPNVGGHLQDHLAVSYFYRSREPTLNQALGTWPGRVRAALQFLASRAGPISLGVNQMGGLARAPDDAPRPNVQLYFNPLSYSTEYVDKRPLLKPDAFPGFIMGYNPCRPTSLGRVDLSGQDDNAPPSIRPNYLATARDVAEAIAGGKLMGRLQRTPALSALIEGALAFDPAQASDEAILADFRARSGSVYHPCGTCRMAPAEDGGVVDPSLRVYGVEGLRVVDASVFPNITSANTNAPTVLVAYKAGETIRTEAAE